MAESGHPLVAAIYDGFMLPQELLGLRKQRARTAKEANGAVIELGVGTGLNLPFYENATRIVGIDPDPHMLRRARRRAQQAAQPVELVEAGAEALPFDDDVFDTAVFTLTLCTVPEPAAAVAEARRVLAPGGRLLFLEHVRSDSPSIARVQDVVTPAWKHVSGGCHWNRMTVETVAREFDVERLWRRGILVQGAARPR